MLSGFAAAGLLAVSMLLMLRLTWLDRAFRGLGRLYQVHHAFGVAAFLLLLVHPLAFALGSLQARPERALRLLWPDPSSAVLFSGWLAVLLFVVFFVVTVTPRIPYRIWRHMHRASGLAYAAMAWHLIAAWSGSLAATLCLVLIAAGVLGYTYRLLGQDVPWRGLRYRVTGVQRRAPNVVDIVLEPNGDSLRFEAGQFVYLALRDSPTYRACGELHPYTITSPADEPRLHLSIKALGECTRHIQELTPGTEAIVKGPFGGLFPPSARAQAQVWIAGGIGVAPFLSRAATVTADHPRVDVVYAAPNEASAHYLEDLRTRIVDRPNMRLHTIFEDPDGLPSVTAVEERVGTLEGRHVMLSGPPDMIRTLSEQLRSRGVPAAHIHSEEGILR